MSQLRQSRGYIDALLIPLIVVGVLFLGTAGFAVWAYMGRQDYKNNSDQKVEVAVEKAVEETEATEAIKYAEEAKNPLKTYVGPSAYGAVTLQYPKTWSSYVVLAGTGPLNAYFHPDYVSDVGDDNNSYALRVQIVSRAYATIVRGYDSEVKTGKVTAVPYSLPKVPSVAGIRFDGQITPKKRGTLIVLPLRNVTLQISTESTDFVRDLDNIILPNLIFSP